MFLDINKIGPEGLSLDEPLDLPALEDAARERIVCRDARLRGELRRGSRGVDFNGRLDATASLCCSRCLEPFEQRIRSDFRLILVPEAAELAGGTDDVAEEDVALFYTREGKADVDEIATEQIYLNLPLKPICREDCKGLCSSCGANLNSSPCDCVEETVDPRLAPLLRWRPSRRDA